MTLCAVRRLNEAVAFRQTIKFLRGALKRETIVECTVQGEDNEDLARDIENKATPLIDHCCLRQRQGKCLEAFEAHAAAELSQGALIIINQSVSRRDRGVRGDG